MPRRRAAREPLPLRRAAGSRGRELAVDHGWSRHGRSVPAGWYHPRPATSGVPNAVAYRPLRVVEEERGPRYLCLLEHQRIATLRRTGLGVRAIPRAGSLFPSTVSRELRRNRRPHDVGGYDGELAHHRGGSERAGRGRVCWPDPGVAPQTRGSANLGIPSKPNPNDSGGVAVLDIHQAR